MARGDGVGDGSGKRELTVLSLVSCVSCLVSSCLFGREKQKRR